MKEPLPLALRILAYVTIFIGISAGLDILIAALFGELHLNPAVLQLPAGIGLLRRSRGWRTFLLMCIWMGYVGFAVGLIGIAVRGGIDITLLPYPFDRLGKEVFILFLAATLAYMIWEHHVLTRPHVRRFFGLSP